MQPFIAEISVAIATFVTTLLPLLMKLLQALGVIRLPQVAE